MEDFLLIQGQFRNRRDEDLFAVFDGHTGPEAGLFVAENFSRILGQMLFETDQLNEESLFLECEQSHLELEPPDSVQSPECARIALALHRTFLGVRDELEQKVDDSGTTVLVAFFAGDHFFIANAGDTRAVLGRGSGESLRLSVDHKPDWPPERKRIEACGGRVVMASVPRVDGLLAVSRCLGDFDLEPRGLSCRPHICVLESHLPDEGEFVILASDGLWDVLKEEEAVSLVAKYFSQSQAEGGVSSMYGSGCDMETVACRKLVEKAYARESVDNISVVIIRLTEAGFSDDRETASLSLKSFPRPISLQDTVTSFSSASSLNRRHLDSPCASSPAWAKKSDDGAGARFPSRSPDVDAEEVEFVPTSPATDDSIFDLQ